MCAAINYASNELPWRTLRHRERHPGARNSRDDEKCIFDTPTLQLNNSGEKDGSEDHGGSLHGKLRVLEAEWSL
jgi:hypothetical protein